MVANIVELVCDFDKCNPKNRNRFKFKIALGQIRHTLCTIHYVTTLKKLYVCRKVLVSAFLSKVFFPNLQSFIANWHLFYEN